MDSNRIEGSATKLGGDIREGVGSAFGDGKMQAEGRFDQARGTAQNALGGVADTVRDAFDRAPSGLRDTATKVGDFAKRNPVIAVLAAGAIASFLGKAMTRKA